VPEDERALVRCLDCGTVYELPLDQEEAQPCPECGDVGWVALEATRKPACERTS
jgi:hypothetical protein